MFATLSAHWQYCRHYPRPPLRLHGEVKAIASPAWVAAELLTPRSRNRLDDLIPGGDLGDIANYMDLNCPALSQLILSL